MDDDSIVMRFGLEGKVDEKQIKQEIQNSIEQEKEKHQKLINYIKSQGWVFIADKVKYVNNYSDSVLKKEDVEKLYKKINQEYKLQFMKEKIIK